MQAFLHRIRQTAEEQQCLSPEHVKTLFSNIESILDVHKEVLSAVEASLQPEPQPGHGLGHVFLHGVTKCPTLINLFLFKSVFQHCMLLGGKKSTDIPLEGHLLSPIQRICKYPLLLKELLKRTPKKHSDYPAVEEALQAMKAVCSNINETKRQMEKLEALEQLQSHIEGWEGTNLTDICTELLLHGNLLKISAGNIQERVFFLFDNLLVYCKRKTKSINGPLYVFRGRINTEVMEVENVEDGTADYHSNNYTVTNGWKLHNTAKNKWFVCMAKNAEDKQKWLDAILREREQRESLKLGMERDAYVMIAKKGEKLYHMMMTKSRHLIKDRRRKLTTVPKCFMGNEFVSWLTESGEISTPDEGVNLGQALLENGIIHHVSDKHQFKNEPVFYRFRYDDGTYKARSEMEDIMSKVSICVGINSISIQDRDYHLKTFKSVLPASKLVDWLLSQGDCSTREEAVTMGVGLCNNAFMHHVLEKTEFKDESQFFRFYADEEMEGTNSKSKQLQRNDFKLIENILVKSLVIHPEEEDYGFEIEEKNKAIVVRSVTRGSHAEMAGLQEGRKIFTINEDLVFLRPFQEVETMISQAFCIRRSLRLLVNTKAKEIVKIPDTPYALSFKLSGSAPPHVHAVRKGSEAAVAGLQPGQCIRKVNGNNMNHSDYQEVLEHFTSHHDQQDHPDMVRHSLCADVSLSDPDYRGGLSQLSLSDDTVPLVSMTVDNVHLEHGVVYEYVSTAGIKCHVLEKMVEPKGCFSLTAKILEAFARDDSHFVRNCSQLISQSDRVMSMPQFEFRNICDTKLESIRRRISRYQQFAQELRRKACPTFKQAGVLTHPLGCMDFVPTNCHVNLMQVSHPKTTMVSGRAFSFRFGRKNSFYGLDPNQANLSRMSHTQHCVTSMGAPSYSSNRGNGLSFLLKQEDMEIQEAYICLYNRLNIAVQEMRQYVTQIDAIQPPSVTPEEGDQEKTEHGGIKRVCFMVTEEDQEDSGQDTMSYRDSYRCSYPCRIKNITLVCLMWKNVHNVPSIYLSLSLSGDELPCDMSIPSDKQDKLHGCLEHLFNQVLHLYHNTTFTITSVITTSIYPSLPLLSAPDTALQLQRDVIFCQSAVSAVCTLAEQLLAALRAHFNNAGEYEEDCKDTSRKWLEQAAAIGVLLNFQTTLAPHVKEERTMLEDTQAALLDLDKVTVFFRQLEDECLVVNTPVCYHVEGTRQALRVTMYLDSCHFSELPTRLQNGGSLKLHTVLFTSALERPEGVSEQAYVSIEEFQQRTNAVALERVKAYYRKLRPLNTLDDLCRLMQSYVNVHPNAAGHPSGVSVLCVSSELCNRLGACHITMCATGIRCTLSVTLDQAMILARNHGLMPRCIMQTMDIMRKQGTRVEISAKNLKVMDQMPPAAPRYRQ
uniref:Phosphatidylinositol-3,4,5-trisphosphate-dependent Rac exchange factor 1 n=1 Tax=Oncorhynchus tshawytscha TaxID=74940 RepID=A0A8C8FII9_ONCTS